MSGRHQRGFAVQSTGSRGIHPGNCQLSSRPLVDPLVAWSRPDLLSAGIAAQGTDGTLLVGNLEDAHGFSVPPARAAVAIVNVDVIPGQDFTYMGQGTRMVSQFDNDDVGFAGRHIQVTNTAAGTPGIIHD